MWPFVTHGFTPGGRWFFNCYRSWSTWTLSQSESSVPCRNQNNSYKAPPQPPLVSGTDGYPDCQREVVKSISSVYAPCLVLSRTSLTLSPIFYILNHEVGSSGGDLISEWKFCGNFSFSALLIFFFSSSLNSHMSFKNVCQAFSFLLDRLRKRGAAIRAALTCESSNESNYN